MSSGPMERSYGCSYGCGNPYDVIIVMVADATTELLCIPCFVKTAADMVEAMVNADMPNMQAALDDMNAVDKVPQNGSKSKSRGRNAPATNDDPDLLEAFDSVITADELPPEFR